MNANQEAPQSGKAGAGDMVSVVIPAYNESDAIREVVIRAHAVLAGRDHEVVVVDDGSRDATAAVAQAAGARVIRHPHNLGYGAALKTGIKEARFDTIVIVDADGTYPLEQVPALIEDYASGYDMVVGARTGAAYRESAFKSPMRLVLKALVEFTAGRQIPDINSGLRVFSRSRVLPYSSHLCNSFSFTTSLTLAYMMTGRFVGYQPITYHRRIGQTKVRLLRDSLRTLQYIVQAILYYNPLKIFLLMCAAVSGIAAGCLAAGAWFRLPEVVYLGIGGVFVAILVFGLGLLADLLRQIMAKD